MHSAEVVKLYTIGIRGMPIRTIGPGDLAEPRARSLWRRIADFGAAVVEVAREARALEKNLLGYGSYRRFSDG